MKLPHDASIRILQNLEMPDLDNDTRAAHTKKLQILRRQLKHLASDFARHYPSEHRYSDAYFAYNFPMNVARTMVVMQEVMQYYPELLMGRNCWCVLDIGCGDGAGLLGAYYLLRSLADIQEFNFLGVDHSLTMLKQARAMARWHEEQDPRLRIRFRVRKIDQNCFRIGHKYDIVLCVNSLAEIVRKETIPFGFINSIVDSLVEDGLLIIIEPALKKYAQRLMRLRDTLRMQSGIQLLLPCMHGSPCPLLGVNKQKEWCHQSVSWSPPGFLEIINQGLNREIDVLKFAYLVIARTSSKQKVPQGYRVVSHLLTEKGKKRCFLCTPRGRVELVKLDRSDSHSNRNFNAITMGSIVNMDRAQVKKDSYWQVIEKTVLEIK